MTITFIFDLTLFIPFFYARFLSTPNQRLLMNNVPANFDGDKAF